MVPFGHKAHEGHTKNTMKFLFLLCALCEIIVSPALGGAFVTLQVFRN